MPVFAYKGVNQAGKPTKGTISAEGPRAARAQMRAAGVFLTELNESEGGLTSESKAGSGSRGLNFEIKLPQRQD